MGEESGRSGLLVRLACLLFSVAPCAVLDARSGVAVLLGIWGVGVGVRVGMGDRKVGGDCVVFGGVGFWVLREGVRRVVGKRWEDLGGGAWSREMGLSMLLGGVVALAGLGLLMRLKYDKDVHAASSSEGLPAGAERWNMRYPRPWFFPCRTTHARMFPKRHAFGYSYLLCGFPIVPAGTTSGGIDVSDGKDTVLGGRWLRVRAGDYLTRVNGELGFYGKLKMFMREQGVEDADWSYAYLVTAPRIFGYSFNPVSFWYIYNRDHVLKKMILEVNNTFGERRIYLLDGTAAASPRTPNSEPPALELSKDKFTDAWMKDFHVSPFNSRKGSYALKARNPFPSPNALVPIIDNTITLKSSKDFAKVVARVNTTGPPLDPSRLGLWGTLQFVGGWWWVGLMTFPRIIREAFKLYFRRSLHVWFRPEVASPSLGRTPTGTEVALQKIFRDYLQHLVNTAREPLQIHYLTAIPDRPQEVIKPTQPHSPSRNVKELNIHVTTPAFYSRFVHYAYTTEALDRECLFTDEKNRTLWISQPDLLSILVPGRPNDDDADRPARRSFLSESRWRLMRKLRCPPAEPAYVITPKSAALDVDDIRTLPYSDLDRFVRGRGGGKYAGDYRRMATKIFCAQRFMLGFAEVIDVIDFGVRAGLCWLAFAVVMASTRGGKLAWRDEWLRIVGAMLCVSSCHVYGLLKGYD